MSSFALPHFELWEESVDECTQLIGVRGEIHVSTASEFGQRLDAAVAGGKTAVALDLEAVQFIDSTGLGVLLNGLRQVTRRNGRLAIALANPTVLRLFEVTGLEATFDIVGTREEALRRVRARHPQGGVSSAGAP